MDKISHEYRVRRPIRCLMLAAMLSMPSAAAQARSEGKLMLPVYQSEAFCLKGIPGAPQSDCLATELTYKWVLSRVWPHLQGQEKDQAEICLHTVDFTLPETGSFRVLAECVAGLSNANE